MTNGRSGTRDRSLFVWREVDGLSARKVKSPGVDALGILVRVVMLGEFARSGYETKSFVIGGEVDTSGRG